MKIIAYSTLLPSFWIKLVPLHLLTSLLVVFGQRKSCQGRQIYEQNSLYAVYNYNTSEYRPFIGRLLKYFAHEVALNVY